MAERRQLGAILLESGRITQDDVQAVLEHQRSNGGFFGQALVALGIVRREEIDWALASQWDLPFIFPNPEAVDRDAARLVPADWALAHLAVPIVRAGKELTVVVADPLSPEVMDDLRARTGCEVDMALASAARIRELIRVVYDGVQSQRVAEEPTTSLNDFFGHALEQGAERFGISIRGTTAVGWWRTRQETHRAPLAEGWEIALEESMKPSPLERMREAQGGSAEWRGELVRGATGVTIDAKALVGMGGYDLLFRALQNAVTSVVAKDVILPPALVAELTLLWRGGAARIGFAATTPDDARAVLPMLPSLALGEHVRAAHINETGTAGSSYTLRAGNEEMFADAVAAQELDAITIDLPTAGYPVKSLLRAAPLSFMLLAEPQERSAPGEWGINWLLTVAGQPGSLAWDLRALHR